MILGRSPSEAAASMSLPEIKLVIMTCNSRWARQQIAATRGACLASGKWGKDPAGELNAFMVELLEQADPGATEPPKAASRSELVGLFAALGVPQAATVPSGSPSR